MAKQQSATAVERPQLGRALEARVRELEEANRRIAELNVDLERRLEEATAQLRHAVERLTGLDELKSQFLSIAAHELRTPITAVSGFAQLALRGVRDRLGTGVDDATRSAELQRLTRQLTIIQDQAGKLGRLVRELLDVSRIQSGHLEFELVPIDLHEVARAVIDQMQMIAPTHRFELRSSGDAVVLGERDHLEQMISSLVDNAVKYSPDGGPITVEVARRGDEIAFSIGDKGIGIPQEQIGLIFDLFFRTREAEEHRMPGLGLGLYITRAIVERHGGRITVESEPGRGTIVRVALPVERADGVAAAGRPRVEVTAG